MASCVRRPGRSRGWISGPQKLSRGFLRLVALLPTLSSPGSLYSGLPQSSPSSSTPYNFPYYKSLLLRRFGSTVGAAIPLFSPVGGRCHSPFVYLLPLSLFLSLYQPSLNKNPTFLYQRVLSGLPEPQPQSEQQGFSSALTRLLAMTSADSIHAHTLV